MTRLEFANAIAFLVAGVGKPLAEDQVKAWFELLGDLTVDQLRRGIVETLRTHQFSGFPAVGVIRKNALGGVQSANLEAGDQALLAWDRVVHAIRTIGAYRTVDFDDPLIAPTIRSIATSWTALCDTESATLHVWTKKAFIETYRAHAASGQVTAIAASPLPGILAENAALSGYEAPEAVVVETRLPKPNIKVLPTQERPRIVAEAETVGKALRQVLSGPDEAVKKITHQTIEDVEGKRAALVAKYRERFGHLLGRDSET